jgi:predicted transcriptional regulator
MMRPNPLGEQELAVLRFVGDHEPISVRDVSSQFGDPRGLARTTILTVMERLRKKGFLSREQRDGSFVYSAKLAKPDLLKTLVHEFVERALDGSVSPFVAYLAEGGKISEREIADLKKLVADIEAKKE